ncbi:MAG: NAD(P)/FAD-dependent oxidoreductase [Polyangiaceae bacterium]
MPESAPVAVSSRPGVSASGPIVVIVGAGMGGLTAARALRKSPVQVIVLDRMNHNLFQPLLYQVATAELSPGQIAEPVRALLRKQKNTTTLLAEVTAVDTANKLVLAKDVDREDVPVRYDYLILATGARGSYFGHDEFARYAPGLKSVADALAIRNKIFEAFERAEAEADPRAHRDLLTFVLVGGGPAGVEMAGAIASLVRKTLRAEFRRIDPTTARVVLIDAGPRLLRLVGAKPAQAARERLESLGVEIRVGQRVEHVDESGVIVGGERILSPNVFWTAGVEPSPAGRWLGAPMDRAGRVRVQPDLSVPGHGDIFVIGDTATLELDGAVLPGVAQVAIQQGRHVGRVLDARVRGRPEPREFRYFDKGNMAVVGPGYAVLQSGRFQLAGSLAFLVWAFIHILYLARASQRVSVFMQWVWTYLTQQQGSRLIVNPREAGAQPSTEAARARPVLARSAAQSH